jgi:sugar/nucleoside kinase (ribokinase family)
VTLVGIHAGLSVDHLVVEGEGARFSCLGGPALFAALGARLVAGTAVRVSCPLPDDEPRFAELFANLDIDTTCAAHVRTVPRLWILNGAAGRRIVHVENPQGTELGDDQGQAVDDLPPLASGFLNGLDGLLASSPSGPVPPGAAATVGVDPHQTLVATRQMGYLREVAAGSSVLLPSRIQLRLLDANPRRAAHLIAGQLHIPVVARLDAEGMYIVVGTRAWTVDDQLAQVVETTGAGDASAAAVVAAMTAGAYVVEATALGVSVARFALAGWGHDALAEAEPMAAPIAGITTHKEH